jgi:hypothetical protein
MMVGSRIAGSVGRTVSAVLVVVLAGGAAAAQPNSDLAAAWSKDCFAWVKKDGARTGRAVRYCECTSSFMPRSADANYRAWRRSHRDEAAFCAQKTGLMAGPGRGY